MSRAFLAEDGLRLLCFLLLAYSAGTITTQLTARCLVGYNRLQRRCGWLLILFALLVGTFALLARLHLFRLDIVSTLAVAHIAITAATQPASLRWFPRFLIGELTLCAASITRNAPRYRLVFFLALTIMCLRLIRSLAIPPISWDSLTYHYFKPALWVQSHGYDNFMCPGGWSYYKYFPQNCEIVWSWFMLPFRSDMIVGAAGMLVWTLIPISAHALCRSMGAGNRNSFLAAFAIAFMPCVVNTSANGYVDNIGLVFWMLGSVFLIRTARDKRPLSALLSVIGVSLAAGIKVSYLPGCLIVMASLAALLMFGQRRTLGSILPKVIGVMAASVIGLHDYFTTWLEKGSPLYPFVTTILGREIVPGNSLFMKAITVPERTLPPAYTEYDVFSLFWTQQLVPLGMFTGRDTFNIGILGFVAFGLGIPALIGMTIRARWSRRLALLALAAALLPVLLSPFSKYGVNYRQSWSHMSSRLLTAPFALLTIAAACSRMRIATPILALVVLVSIPQLYPIGMSDTDYAAVAWIALISCVCVGACFLAIRSWQSGHRLRNGWCAAAIVAALFAWGEGTASVRARYRYPIYEKAAHGWSYDGQFSDNHIMNAYAIWSRLDRVEPATIAVTSDDMYSGANWFLYPFLGSRFQHRLAYVSPRTDNRITPEPTSATAIRKSLPGTYDLPGWRSRLADAGVDYVASLYPSSGEIVWMLRSENPFRLVEQSAYRETLLFEAPR